MHTSIVDVWKQFKHPHETSLYTDFVCVVLCGLAHLVHFSCGTSWFALHPLEPGLLASSCLVQHFQRCPHLPADLLFAPLPSSTPMERFCLTAFQFFRSFGVSVRILWVDNIFVTFVYYYNHIRVIFICESLFVEFSRERFRFIIQVHRNWFSAYTWREKNKRIGYLSRLLHNLQNPLGTEFFFAVRREPSPTVDESNFHQLSNHL